MQVCQRHGGLNFEEAKEIKKIEND